jgi:hypothetical protein
MCYIDGQKNKYSVLNECNRMLKYNIFNWSQTLRALLPSGFPTDNHRLSRLPKESVQVRGSLMTFVTNLFFYGERLLAPRPTPKLEDHPLSSQRGCLFNVFAANLHSWRPSLYPRPDDAPCCGVHTTFTNIKLTYV